MVPPCLDILLNRLRFGDMVCYRSIVSGFLVSLVAVVYAYETPLPLGAADLAPGLRLEVFKAGSQALDLEQAFEIEAIKQLDLKYEVEAPNELETLKREHELLKIRVLELERRLYALEARSQDA